MLGTSVVAQVSDPDPLLSRLAVLPEGEDKSVSFSIEPQKSHRRNMNYWKDHLKVTEAFVPVLVRGPIED